MLEFLSQLPQILSQTLMIATPLIFTAMAGLFCERSGVVDIGLEGKLILTAFTSAIVSYYVIQYTGVQDGFAIGALAGLIAAIIVGILTALIHAFASISKQGDQVVSGVAINLFAQGVTIVIARALFGTGDTPEITAAAGRFPIINLPYASQLKGSFLGDLYAITLSGQSLLTWIAVLLVPLVWWVLYKTRFGLHLRAVGENPHAVDTAGISVTKLRYKAVIIGGILSGFAGTYLAIGASAQFTRDMSAGRGYIALVVLILGKWRPKQTLVGCLVFSFLNAISFRISWLPNTVSNMMPYLLTLVIMIFVGKSVAPAAIGTPYKKER